MRVKILKLNEAAIIPKYSHADDAGLDLFSSASVRGNNGFGSTGIVE